MPFALVFIGLVMIITGVFNTYSQLGTQLKTDGTAFTKWMVAIGLVGAAGYVEDLRQLSRWFLALIIISMVLANKGFFANFGKAINAGPATIQGTPTSTSPANSASPVATQSGAFGQAPDSSGQAKANGWFNYFSKQLFGG